MYSSYRYAAFSSFALLCLLLFLPACGLLAPDDNDDPEISSTDDWIILVTVRCDSTLGPPEATLLDVLVMKRGLMGDYASTFVDSVYSDLTPAEHATEMSGQYYLELPFWLGPTAPVDLTIWLDENSSLNIPVSGMPLVTTSSLAGDTIQTSGATFNLETLNWYDQPQFNLHMIGSAGGAGGGFYPSPPAPYDSPWHLSLRPGDRFSLSMSGRSADDAFNLEIPGHDATVRISYEYIKLAVLVHPDPGPFD